MKIKKIQIQNFRSFKDETFSLNSYSCFVGPNGAGKSNILSALNVFFCEQTSSVTEVSKLSDEDYFGKNTDEPIKITVTFGDLSSSAQEQLSNYVRQNELVVTAEANFDPETGIGQVRHYGQRMGMQEFRRYFEAEKLGVSATDLSAIYSELQDQYPELPNARSKEAKATALQAFESAHSDSCVLIPSEDNFYGFTGAGKLRPFVQWIYVPAVKDASEEGQESRNTALSRLIARAVGARTNINAGLEQLKEDTLARYHDLLVQNRASLQETSRALQARLESWAHPNVRLDLEWLSDPNKSVVLQQPIAGVKVGEGDFLGSLARMGHGLQRSYLLALLEELADSEAEDAPTLILGCEEPELYQHPPQARHLSDVFNELTTGNNQIIVTTHSPLFVSGEGFENVRLVRRLEASGPTKVSSLTYQGLCSRIREVLGEDPLQRNEGLVAKIHQTLQPNIAEMFFARVPVLVEGLEDTSFITTEFYLSGKWLEFRRLGCHLIPTNGKSALIYPLCIAIALNLPVFIVFDADGNVLRDDLRTKHEKENRALISLLQISRNPFPPSHVWGNNHVIWQTNLSDVIQRDFGSDYARLTEETRLYYAQEGGLEKNELFIAEWMSRARNDGLSSESLSHLCESIIHFAQSV